MSAMQAITGVKNPRIISARELATPKGRREQCAFLCDGEHMVSEALAASKDGVRTLFVDSEKLARFAPLIDKAAEKTAVYAVPEHVLAAVSQVKTPQGIAAVVELPPPVPLAALGEKLVLLENVQDPGNVGTILRTLDAAGFQGCILTSGCADPFAPKALRATMGSVFRVPLTFAESEEAIVFLKEQGYGVLAAELHGEPFYARKPLPDRLCLMIGNEGAGLSARAVSGATHRFALPMAGGAESLNAAVAAAVMMYDLMQR